MRLLVSGTRQLGYNRKRETVLDTLDEIHLQLNITTLIEGGAAGVDAAAADWARSKGIQVETFVAEWTKFGARAGLIRNEQMLVEGKPDRVVAFPSKESRGTRHMISFARSMGFNPLVVELG